MGIEKLEARQEKAKEMFEEKARQKQEEEQKPVEAEKKKEEKPKKKAEVKKPVVTEAVGRGEYLPISTKEAVELSRAIRGKILDKANKILDGVIKLERPVKYFRFNKEVPHQKGKGFGPGRFPQKAATFVKGVLENAVANAKYLNLDADRLYIKSIIPNRAMSKQRQGRYTHLKITVAEVEKEKKVKK